MGDNIYVHTELKVRGKWIHWEQPYVDRDYELFAKMGAGDHPEHPAVAPLRGFPGDASATTRWSFGLMSADLHSASWLSAAEADDVTAWFNANRPRKNLLGIVFRSSWPGLDTIQDLDKHPRLIEAGLEDARLIFWFTS